MDADSVNIVLERKRDDIMNRFCQDVIDFLNSEYSDAYDFKLEKRTTLPPPFSYHYPPKLELSVKLDRCYTLKITNDSMQYLFSLYNSGEYIQERKQWRWQKELVDMIEGS